MVARSMRLLERLGAKSEFCTMYAGNTLIQSDVDSLGHGEAGEARTWAEVTRLCEKLYREECSRVVLLVLREHGGLDVVRRMRESLGSEPSFADWPVSELLWTPSNRAGYQAVGRLVNALRTAKEGENCHDHHRLHYQQ